ncbi:MAG: glycoside hydrolase family 3 protein [Bacteroidales bacterium]
MSKHKWIQKTALLHCFMLIAVVFPGSSQTPEQFVRSQNMSILKSDKEVREADGEPFTRLATLDEMIGQMIMVGLKGTDLQENQQLLETLKQGKAGGVIFFEKNLSPDSTAIRVRSLISDLQMASLHPLLIAIDQEGGRVNRLKARYGFPDSKTATWLGDQNHCDTTWYYAEQTATTLKALGFNINFAPVVDLCTNPTNPVIAVPQRCFSSNPEMVTKHAGWYIDAHRSKGVLTTLKHFPGHGSSTKDTHKEMTDITNLWRNEELIPYQKLIQSDRADAIMTAHIIHCRLDTGCLPATLSKTIISGLLRDSLGYQGIVFTDDMQMHAITKHYGLEQSIKLALLAGVDILLFSNNIPGSKEHQATVVHKIIRDLVDTGVVTEARIRESYERITRTKQTLFPSYPFPL